MRDDEGRICHFTSCSPPLLSVGYDDVGMEQGGNGTRRAALSRTMRERESGKL